MTTLQYILVFTLLGSLVSLVGGVLLIFSKRLASRAAHLISAFAAGAFLGAVFFDLLPEAAETAGEDVNIFAWTFAGIIAFYLLERTIHWFHHHPKAEDHAHDATVPLIILGDTIHNFVDGIVIAATFMTDIRLGMVTTLAVAAHEIPQEIGDFGVLLQKGLSRGKTLVVNVLSAVAALVGAVLTYYVGGQIEGVLPIFLALTAGFFIYIATSDLIPEIHHNHAKNFAAVETLLLFAGAGVVWLAIELLEHSA